MAYTYKGIRATWNYSKHCWVVSFNGVNHYCLEDELENTIDELLADE